MKETLATPVALLYIEVVRAMYLDVREDGVVISPLSDDQPMQIGENIVAIPTPERIEADDWKGFHAFHPLCEDSVMGQSETTHWLIARATAAITLRLVTLMSNLLEVAHKTELQAQAGNPNIETILAPIAKMVTKTSYGSWKKIVKKLSTTPLLNYYIVRGAEINGETFQRVGTLEIPILEDVEANAILTGVTLSSKNDKLCIRLLLEKLLEGVPMEYGTNHATPYFYSILMMYEAVNRRLNKVSKIFKKVTADEPVDLKWWDEAKDDGLKKLMKRIPRLPGNEGVMEVRKRGKQLADEELDIMRDNGIKLRTVETVDTTPPWDGEDTPAPASKPSEPRPTGGISLNSLLGGKGDVPSRELRDRYGSDREYDRDADRDDRYERDRGRGSRDRDRGRREIDLIGGRGRGRDSDRRDDRDRDRRDSGRSGGISLSTLLGR